MNEAREELLFGDSDYSREFRAGALKHILMWPLIIAPATVALIVGYMFVLTRVLSGHWSPSGLDASGTTGLIYAFVGICTILCVAIAVGAYVPEALQGRREGRNQRFQR